MATTSASTSISSNPFLISKPSTSPIPTPVVSTSPIPPLTSSSYHETQQKDVSTPSFNVPSPWIHFIAGGTFPRVLYLDVDVHHGDGVEEAFYSTDRVMTVSFHLFGNGFFPGTGDINDIGVGHGKNYAVNVPLSYGIDDDTYHSVFQPVVSRVMEWYRPAVVVLQLGADSVAGDKLGMFNVSMKGHGRCVEFLKRFQVPLLMLGGGGYTIRNVARVWTYETALAVGQSLPLQLPYNEFIRYYGPEYLLDVPATNIPNTNTPAQLNKIISRIFEVLRQLPFAPSVPLQEVPKDPDCWRRNKGEGIVDEDDPDIRLSVGYRDRRVTRENEYSDSEDEDGDHRHNRYNFRGSSSIDTKSVDRSNVLSQEENVYLDAVH
ncbi:Histone deacetylase 1 [Coelomomyces lativittatus]|nr:Histone deacetylase 1 [Coelomomyces lativittatus]